MGFTESLRTCFGKYAKFDGRASRSEFWYFVLFCFVYFLVAGFLLGFSGVSDAAFDGATLVLLIPIFIPSIAVAARRLHDINQSGWMQCIFIPGFIADEFLGTGFVIYILTLGLWAFWFSQAGKKGKNRFGVQPRK
jgi:uncharacterized membrane protein YhaH (DUF805 family)|tara:strand:+ start:209 stop:616 length:408 start_codon:yes stop_codon:yes gene_type:complete